jgi:XTP/dITP diphosphohydrolase
MEKLVFATNNRHKISEVKAILANKFEVLSLSDIGCYDEIPETAPDIEGNAFIKANWVKEKYGYDCFADDTGLEVSALNGAPGVFSARYAGENVSYTDNNLKLMKELDGISNRNACFRTVICLLFQGKSHFFEGKVDGKISNDFKGSEGFGYDPIFIPNGFLVSYAEMGTELKNSLSHRALAVNKLVEFLEINHG